MATRLLTGGYTPIATGLEPNMGCADMLVEALCGRVEAITDDVDYPGRLGRSRDGPRRSAGVLRPERIAEVIALSSALIDAWACHPAVRAIGRAMAPLDDRGVHGLITSRCVDGHCYRRYHRDLRAVFARRMRWFPSIPGMTIYGERFWPVVCAVLGLTETTDDPRFATPEAREANRREVITIFDEAFARITYPDWERAVHKHGLIATRVNELTDLATDEQILANEYIQPG